MHKTDSYPVTLSTYIPQPPFPVLELNAKNSSFRVKWLQMEEAKTTHMF